MTGNDGSPITVTTPPPKDAKSHEGTLADRTFVILRALRGLCFFSSTGKMTHYPGVGRLDGPATMLHVQFRQTEDSRRLDRSCRGWHRRPFPGLVDAEDVRSLNSVYSPLSRFDPPASLL